MDRIEYLYEKVRCIYASLTMKQINELMRGIHMNHSKTMFSAEDGKTFDYQEPEICFLKNDCAILTTFCATGSELDSQTIERLIADIKEEGLGYIRVESCFYNSSEAKGTEYSHTDSFFVYNKTEYADSLKFFRLISMLSEKYGQNGFLYKRSGMNRTAVIVSTKSESLKQYGEIKFVGKLDLSFSANFHKGRCIFIPDPKTEYKKPENVDHIKRAPQVNLVEKHFDKLDAKGIVLSRDGDVKVGRYTIGHWQKLFLISTFHYPPSLIIAPENYAADLNDYKGVRTILKSDLCKAIAEACKGGITGSFERI